MQSDIVNVRELVLAVHYPPSDHEYFFSKQSKAWNGLMTSHFKFNILPKNCCYVSYPSTNIIFNVIQFPENVLIILLEVLISFTSLMDVSLNLNTLPFIMNTLEIGNSSVQIETKHTSMTYMNLFGIFDEALWSESFQNELTSLRWAVPSSINQNPKCGWLRRVRILFEN